MKKAIRYLAQTALFLAALYAVLWLAEAIGDLLCVLIPW